MRARSLAAAGGLALLCGAALAGPAAGGRSLEYVPGQVVVAFEAGSTAGLRADSLRDRGGEVVEELFLPGAVLVRLPAGQSVEAGVASYEADPDVEFAEPNFLYHTWAIPNDTRFNELWGLHQASDRDIDAPEAWDLTTGSSSVVVAVVDTGVAYDHPDLLPNMWANPGEVPGDGLDNDGNGRIDDTRGWDFVQNDNTPLDQNGHGTHVAGTVGARGNNLLGVTGVSWQVQLMAVRGADQFGNLTSSTISNSFAYACGEGARIVNGSFGGPPSSMQVAAAINAPACAGTLFVFAAGNEGSNNDVSPRYPCNYTTPQLTVDRVVCVAATTQSDARASFSNFGATSVDLGAPGFSILSTVPGAGEYAYASGTSMASPHVAGVAALALARNPGLTVTQLRTVLLAGVDSVAGLTVATGGRLNARGTVALAPAPPPPPPPAPPPPPPPPAPPPPPPPPPAVDSTAPNTRITRGPAGATTARRARFRFTSTEVGSSFQCRLDRGPWRSCRSGKSYRGLGRGGHTFRVRAIDLAGNVDRSAANRRWRVR